MSEEVFILRSNRELVPGQAYYAIPGLKSELLEPLGKLNPTEASIVTRTLEWVIPNTPHNRAWVARHYSHFKVLKLEEKQEMPPPAEVVVRRMPGRPLMKKATTVEEAPAEPSPEDPEDRGPEIEGGPEGAPETLEEAPDGMEDFFITPKDPNEIKTLKASILVKLNELGVAAPKNSTLKTLQELLKADLK